MPITKDVNIKANIRQNTDSDALASAGQPVIATYKATSAAGQTLIPSAGSLPFAVDQANKDGTEVFIDGKLMLEGAGNDYVYTQVDGNNTSSKIQLSVPLSAGINIVVIKRGLKKEQEFQTDNRFNEIYDMAAAGFQGFVDQSTKLTPVNGVPAAGQFRTFGIVGRASIPDLANDLRANMGSERIMVQNIVELQNEYGSLGERVYKALNDDRDLIRFVGNFTSVIGDQGQRIVMNSGGIAANDYVEVVFYGTGLNILHSYAGVARDIRVTVDNGAESGSTFVPNSANAINSRGYSTNQISSLCNGLSLGIHTVKIRNNTAGQDFNLFGFEILNESAQLKVNPGIAYANGKKLVNSAIQSVAHNSGFDSILRDGSSVGSLGARGARVLVYQKSDGTIGKSAIEADSVQGNLAAANHSNEELIRTYTMREFGANRSDDFSTLVSSSDRAFTLDDGTTTLVGKGVRMNLEGVDPDSAGDYITFTFVGTGLDISQIRTGVNSTYDISVDGISIATNSSTLQPVAKIKIVSGLPYGTHTVKIAINSVSTTATFREFYVYGPKKPSLPAGAVEIADYNVMATFVANSVASTERISTGTIRKIATREFTYVNGTGGTIDWAVQTFDDRFIPFTSVSTDRQNAYMEYTFVGTGFDARFWLNTSRDSNITVSLNGTTLTSANFPTMTSGTYGDAGVSFTAATGILDLSTTGASVPGCGFYVSGLPLAKYTLRFNKNTAGGTAFLQMETLDIITPIHSVKSNTLADLQNTLSVGSCSISDNRKLSPVKSESVQKNWAQAVGVASAPSTTSTTYVPIPDMSLVFKSRGSRVSVSTIVTAGAAAGVQWSLALYVNGVNIYATSAQTPTSGYDKHTFSYDFFLAEGTHKVELYWLVNSGTLTSLGTSRNLTIKEL